MATNQIQLTPVLSVDDYNTIDQFCNDHTGIEALPELAVFLKQTFSLDMTLESDIVVGFTADSSNLPGNAQALCRPASERDCAIIFRACFQAKIPYTISGGRSNLTGSATPQSGVVISTIKLLTPALTVDDSAQTATVASGMLLEEMREQILRETKNALCFPVDPTSRAEASIGGALACNASGFTPGETGAFRAWVASMRFLLPNGYLVTAARDEYVAQNGEFLLSCPDGLLTWSLPAYERPAIKNAGGPYSAPTGAMDFIDLVIGSEGLFGLVTSATLKLKPRPKEYLDLFFSLPGETEAVRFLQAVLAHFDHDLSHLSAFEYFGVHCRKYMKHEDRFFHGEDQVALYIQEPLIDREMEDAVEVWLELLTEAEIDIDEDAILLLDTEQLRSLFMEARHSMPANALEVVQHRGTFTIMTDAVVPADQFSTFLDFTHQLLNDKQLDYLSFGHFGDCHLHFTILPEKNQIEQGVDAYDAIIAKSAELGGVYSGEHGTGKRKRKDFLRCYGEEAIQQVKRTKLMIDPECLLNRGNVFEY